MSKKEGQNSLFLLQNPVFTQSGEGQIVSMILGGVEREPRLMLGLDENNNVIETFLLFSGCWGFEREEEIENELGGGVSWVLGFEKAEIIQGWKGP